MEKELAFETTGSYNPKLGYGGLVDIEFIVQYQQLMHGAEHLSIRSPNSREALAELARQERDGQRERESVWPRRTS